MTVQVGKKSEKSVRETALLLGRWEYLSFIFSLFRCIFSLISGLISLLIRIVIFKEQVAFACLVSLELTYSVYSILIHNLVNIHIYNQGMHPKEGQIRVRPSQTWRQVVKRNHKYLYIIFFMLLTTDKCKNTDFLVFQHENRGCLHH